MVQRLHYSDNHTNDNGTVVLDGNDSINDIYRIIFIIPSYMTGDFFTLISFGTSKLAT